MINETRRKKETFRLNKTEKENIWIIPPGVVLKMVPPGVSEYRDGMCWGSVICTRRTGMLAVVVILLML